MSYKEFQELRNQITSVLDESLKRLENIKNNNQTDTDQSTSSAPVQKQNEPVNKKKTSKINNQSTTTAKKVL